jgi:hypothetical protein
VETMGAGLVVVVVAVRCRETFFLLARSIQETSRVPVARELRSMLCGCTPAPLTRKHEAHVECGVLEAEVHLSFYSERLKNYYYISKFFLKKSNGLHFKIRILNVCK